MAVPQLSTVGGFLAFAGAAGVISAVLTQVLTSTREWYGTRREAKYLALRLAVILEEFADACISIISDADTYGASGGAAGSRTSSLPKLSTYPEDERGWRSLSSAFSAEALSLPNTVRAYQQAIDFTWHISDFDDAHGECEQASVILGYHAWHLAKTLRAKHGFPAFVPKYDMEAVLAREMSEVMRKQNRDQRAEDSKELL